MKCKKYDPNTLNFVKYASKLPSQYSAYSSTHSLSECFSAMYVIMDVFSVMSPSLMALLPVVQEIQTTTHKKN
jgi:hypothetical protein